LSSQEPFYVRCIKPNEDKVAGKLDEGHCRHQVAYLGLLENVRVRRAGFASRQPYARFLLRYGPFSRGGGLVLEKFHQPAGGAQSNERFSDVSAEACRMLLTLGHCQSWRPLA